MLSLALISVTMKKQSGTFSCKTNAWVSNNSSTSTWDRTWRNNQYFSGTNTQTGSFNIKSVIYTSEPLQRHSEAKSTKYLAKLSSTPLVSNPSILTTPPKRRIHFVNYLDDNDSQKQWKQTQRQRCRAQSTLTSPEIRNVPAPCDNIFVLSTSLLCSANKTRGGLGGVCATGMYHSFGHGEFAKFQTGLFVD